MKLFVLFTIALLAINQVSCQNSYYVETRKVSSGVSGSGQEFAYNLLTQVLTAEQPSGYCGKSEPTFPLDNTSMCGGPNQNIGWLFFFQWNDAEAANWEIEFGTDFGRGGAVFVNGEYVTSRTDDLWWGGNWSSSDVLSANFQVNQGQNTMTVVGSEGCCDGNMNIRFKRNGSEWQDWNIDNLNCAIPAPRVHISAESRQHAGTATGSDADFGFNLQEIFWNAQQPDGYCYLSNPQWPITNKGNCGGNQNQNIAWRFAVEAELAQNESVEFEFGVDFGNGGAVFVNGEWVLSRTDDLWWGGSNWAHTDVINFTADLQEGFNQVEVYGLEGCCDGSDSARFRVEGGEWQNLDVNNWEAHFPEPPKTIVEIETRQGTGKPSGSGSEFAANMIDAFHNADQPQGYCNAWNPTWPLQSSSLCGANQNIYWRFSFSFDEPEYASYEFDFGADFGWGAVFYLNGVLQNVRTDDLWWANNWDSNDTVQFVAEVMPGENQLVVYAGEGCCDGNFNVRFQRNGAGWNSLNDAEEVLQQASSTCGSSASMLIQTKMQQTVNLLERKQKIQKASKLTAIPQNLLSKTAKKSENTKKATTSKKHLKANNKK